MVLGVIDKPLLSFGLTVIFRGMSGVSLSAIKSGPESTIVGKIARNKQTVAIDPHNLRRADLPPLICLIWTGTVGMSCFPFSPNSLLLLI